MSKINEMKVLHDKYNAARADFLKQGGECLHDAFDEFFEQNPEVVNICWTQYAPHFNDGDACEWHINEFCLHLTPQAKYELLGLPLPDPEDEIDEEVSYNDFWESDSWKLSDSKNPRAHALHKAFQEFYNIVVDEELFRDIFGESSQVIAKKGLIKKDYCEHD